MAIAVLLVGICSMLFMGCLEGGNSFSSVEGCDRKCVDLGYDYGKCESLNGINATVIVGSCTIKKSSDCGKEGLCDCYCYDTSKDFFAKAKMSVNRLTNCSDTGNTTIRVTNISPGDKIIEAGSLETEWPYGVAANNSTSEGTCPPTNLKPSESALCVMVDFRPVEWPIHVYGENVSKHRVSCESD